MFDENTLKVIQKMDQLVEEILSGIKSLDILSYGAFSFSTDAEELRSHLIFLVENKLLPIAEHFH